MHWAFRTERSDYPKREAILVVDDAICSLSRVVLYFGHPRDLNEDAFSPARGRLLARFCDSQDSVMRREGEDKSDWRR